MKYLFTAVTCLILISACSSDTEPWTSAPLGTDAAFRDIRFTDRMNGWITGGTPFAKGGILGRTTDGGATWDFETGLVHSSSNLFYLHAIDFADSVTGCIVGSGGVILRTTDGGQTWRRQRGGVAWAHLRDIDFIGQHGWAVGESGVLRTEDGGGTWQPMNDDLKGWAVRFVDVRRGFVAGKHARVHRSVDSGETWEQLDVTSDPEPPDFFTMAFADDQTGWVAGQRGLIFKTTDGGDTWSRQRTGVPHFLTGMHFTDTNRGWVCGFNRELGNSVILHTVDGGATWIVQATVPGEELWAIQMMSDTGWAVGDRVRENPQQFLTFTSPEER